MPIYEFKCLHCGECSELLMMNEEEKLEIKCKNCKSYDLERILSNFSCTTSNSSGTAAAAGNRCTSKKTRTCSSGSCTTYNIPGLT